MNIFLSRKIGNWDSLNPVTIFYTKYKKNNIYLQIQQEIKVSKAPIFIPILDYTSQEFLCYKT